MAFLTTVFCKNDLHSDSDIQRHNNTFNLIFRGFFQFHSTCYRVFLPLQCARSCEWRNRDVYTKLVYKPLPIWWTTLSFKCLSVKRNWEKSFMLTKTAFIWSVILWNIITTIKIYFFLFLCILKLNLLLWWKSWIVSSHYSSLQCHMMLYMLICYINISSYYQFWK